MTDTKDNTLLQKEADDLVEIVINRANCSHRELLKQLTDWGNRLIKLEHENKSGKPRLLAGVDIAVEKPRGVHYTFNGIPSGERQKSINGRDQPFSGRNGQLVNSGVPAIHK